MDVLVRDMSPELKKALAVRAAEDGLSLSDEIKTIIYKELLPQGRTLVDWMFELRKAAGEEGWELEIERHPAREFTFDWLMDEEEPPESSVEDELAELGFGARQQECAA